MVYKILIEFKLKPVQPVANEDFEIHLKLTNIGDSVFPGGELTKFSVRVGEVGQDTTKSTLQKIPPIKVNEFVELKPNTFSTIQDGAAWVQVQLKASDGQEVNLFQNPETSMGQTWLNAFPVKSQEYLTITKLLQSIVKLLEKSEKL